tara:strand:- start:638 stop:1321 length:684 start_codon:yes stop_codon:yes gene_type:complete
MNWKDILKNAITQGRVKEIEDIDIDIEDDDCRRWLKRLDQIIKSYKPTHKMHAKIRTDGDINEVTEEQACLIKSKLENHDGSMVIGQYQKGVEGGAGFFYSPDGFEHSFILVAILPRDREWGIEFIPVRGADSFRQTLLKEFVKPDEPFLQLFDDLVSFYEPYGKMIKQFSKHCNNRVFFDNYISYVARRVKGVLSMRSKQLGSFRSISSVEDDVFERSIKKKFGGY